MTPSPGKYTFCQVVFKHRSADFSFSYAKFFFFLRFSNSKKNLIDNKIFFIVLQKDGSGQQEKEKTIRKRKKTHAAPQRLQKLKPLLFTLPATWKVRTTTGRSNMNLLTINSDGTHQPYRAPGACRHSPPQ